MARKYHVLNYSDRCEAEKLYKNGHTNVQIAAALGVSRQTMYREFKRGYNPDTNRYEASRAQMMIFS